MNPTFSNNPAVKAILFRSLVVKLTSEREKSITYDLNLFSGLVLPSVSLNVTDKGQDRLFQGQLVKMANFQPKPNSCNHLIHHKEP